MQDVKQQCETNDNIVGLHNKNMKAEKLEQHARRNNLRLFGIQENAAVDSDKLDTHIIQNILKVDVNWAQLPLQFNVIHQNLHNQ